MSQVFLLLKLDIDQQQQREVDLSYSAVHNNFLVALKSLFGEVGAGYPLEILKINRDRREILVATFPDYLVKLRQAPN